MGMIKIKAGFLMALVVLFLSETASARGRGRGIDWEKDPVKAAATEPKVVVPDVASVPAQLPSQAASKKYLGGEAIARSGILPPGSDITNWQLVINQIGGVEAEYGVCRTQKNNEKPICASGRFAFSKLRYDEKRQAIFWDENLVAAAKDNRFVMMNGFVLKAKVVPVFFDPDALDNRRRPAGQFVFVSIDNTAIPAPPLPFSPQ